MMFVDITEYISCKYELEINDKLIGNFFGHHDFKKLVISYIKSRIQELTEKGSLDDSIIYSVRVRDYEFFNKKKELIAKGIHSEVPDYVNVGKYARSIKKYMGKNIYQLVDILSITIKSKTI